MDGQVWSADRGEGVGSELAQDVEAAAGELAGDGQRRARVREPALFEREIVGVIGAGGLAGRLGGFVERPAQRRGALAGDPAGPRASVGAVQANVQAPLQRTALREADRRVTSPSS